MAKRIKPVHTVPVIHSLEEADSALAQIAAFQRQLELIQNTMNDSIDAIKLEAEAGAEPLKQEIASLEKSLLHFAELRKAELFTVKKSMHLQFGTIGFRASTKLKLIGKMSWERVLQALRDTGQKACIRVKEEPDKEALKGLEPNHLQSLGCKVVPQDTFFYELETQELTTSNGPGAAA